MVFKVSTIGDCYLPTLGISDIQDDHAEVMAKFSVEFQKIFEVVITELSYTLVSETTYLKLRCALRSSFEIFDDTVNTASCMERTGIPTRIQLSKATTDLLIKAGK